MFFTWLDNKQREANLISAINEAEKLHKETGAKVLVFNSKDGVAVVKKNQLNRKKLMEKKAFYKTK